MKTTKWILFLAGCGACFAPAIAQSQKSTEHISKQFTLQKAASVSVVAIHNLVGSIKVEGYNGNSVVIEIDQTITADTQEELQLAKNEFKLGFDQQADSIIAYTAEPYDTRPQRKYRDENNRRNHYQVKLDYTVKVPFAISLQVATVNSGTIDINDVYGSLKVNNVNGGVTIVNAKGTSSVRTVNGGITVKYLSAPPENSSYNTINGKLEITYPAALAANLQFKSLNGQFFTDFENTEALPTKVEKTQSQKSDATIYKLNKNTEIRIGAGGVTLKFETLNGNIYIKKS